MGFPPGGSVDQVARILAPVLQQQLGQTMVVDNKGGASGGGGPLMNDAIAGHVPLSIATVFVTKPHLDSKRLRPLAVTTTARSPQLPDVPTLAESGFAGFDAPAWWAVLAAARTPPEIIKRMNEEINIALKSPEVAGKLVNQGIATRALTAAAAQQFIEDQIDIWARVVRENNIKSD